MDPAQLKASYDQTQYLTDIIGNVNTNLLKTQNDQNVEGLKSQFAQTKDILDYQDRAQYANENRQNRNFSLLNDGIKDQGAQIKDSIYKTNATVLDTMNKGSSDNLLATERVGSHVTDNIYRTTMGIDQDIYRSQTAVQDTINLGRIESQRTTNELIGYHKNQADQNWSNFNTLSLALANGVGSVMKENADNKGDLAKQMAFQYGDLKDKIATSESNIKDVLRVQEADRLRDALRATEHKSLYFELKDRHHYHGRRRRHH
jgi:hypothetical protein